jgi:hypothetical protein
MKLKLSSARDRGMAVLLVIVLLAVMLGFVLAAAQCLTHLKSDLKLIERDQTNRLATALRPPRAP